jgi:hypothetical protein
MYLTLLGVIENSIFSTGVRKIFEYTFIIYTNKHQIYIKSSVHFVKYFKK